MNASYMLCWVLVAISTGTAVAWYELPLFAHTLLPLAASIFRTFKAIRSWQLLTIVLLYAIAAGNVALREAFAAPLPQIGTHVTMHGIVLDLPRRTQFGREQMLVETENIGKVKLELEPSSELPFMGDEIYFSGEVAKITTNSRFNERLYLRSQGIKLKITDAQIFDMRRPRSIRSQILQSVGNWRVNVAGVHRALLNRDAGAIMQVMLVGRSSSESLPQEINSLSRRLGVSHIFAPSGAHFTCIIFLLGLILGSVKLPSKIRWGLLGLLMTMYAVLAGWSPSISRAWIIATIVLLGNIWHREVNMINSLLFAACISLLLDPNCIGDIGFQFSYLATLGLLVFNDRLIARMPLIPENWALPIATSLSAQLLVLPLQLLYFGNIPLYSPLANVVAVPLASLILISGLLNSIVAACGSLGIFLAGLLETIPLFTIELLTAWLKLLGNLPGIDLTAKGIHPAWVIWSYAAIIVLANAKLVGAWGKHILCASACGIALSHLLSPAPLKLSFISTGKAEGVLLTDSDGRNTLIADGNPWALERTLLKQSIMKLANCIGSCPPHGGKISIQRRYPSSSESFIIEIGHNLIVSASSRAALIEYNKFSAFIGLKPGVAGRGKFSLFKASPNERKYNIPQADVCAIPFSSSRKNSSGCGRTLSLKSLKRLAILTDGEKMQILPEGV